MRPILPRSWQTGLLALATFPLSFATEGISNGSAISPIEREVLIIGGGSSGTYTAIRLQQMGKSVALIEKNGRLGGQVNTYTDPSNDKYIDYGVKVFTNVSVTSNYFESLGVPLKTFQGYLPNQQTVYGDLAAGTVIPASAVAYLAGNVTEGFLRYQAQLEKYPWLRIGWHLPSPLPTDLLLPWGDFVQKYNISAISSIVSGIVGSPGNLLAQPTLYVAKNYGMLQLMAALKGLSVTERDDNNQRLYDSALQKLGRNAFLDSRPVHIDRSGETGKIVATVETPSGLVRIKASKLIVTVPPTIANLSPFLFLSKSERVLFRQFNTTGIWTSIVSHSGIPSNASLANVNLKAPLGIPPAPLIFLTEPTGDNLHIVLYGSVNNLPQAEVKENIIKGLFCWATAYEKGKITQIEA